MIAIIEYNGGNVRSVANALVRQGQAPLITTDVDEIRAASHVIFPGVGSAASAMGSLREQGLASLIPTLNQPVLGICLGMQLLCAHSEEGETPGLGIFSSRVGRFRIDERVPHMGWNSLQHTTGPLFNGIDDGQDMYFVHSYRAEIGPETCAQGIYQETFSTAFQKDNFFGVQFHPEKSAKQGAQLLQNFLAL